MIYDIFDKKVAISNYNLLPLLFKVSYNAQSGRKRLPDILDILDILIGCQLIQARSQLFRLGVRQVERSEAGFD